MSQNSVDFTKPVLSPGPLPNPNWGASRRAAQVGRESTPAVQEPETRAPGTMDKLAAKLATLQLPVLRDVTVGERRHHIVVTAGDGSRRPFLIFNDAPARTLSLNPDAARLQAGVTTGDVDWAFGVAQRFVAETADRITIQVSGAGATEIVGKLCAPHDVGFAAKVLGRSDE